RDRMERRRRRAATDWDQSDARALVRGGDRGFMRTPSTNAVLCWPGRLLAEDNLRRHWTSQREIVLGPKTIVTPLALDFLKGKRVAIRRDDKASDNGVSTGTWGIAVE